MAYQSEAMPKEGAKVTKTLLFSIFIAVFGNSLLYGYNIGVINTPSKMIIAFYNETFTLRNNEEPSENFLTFQWSLTVSLFVATGMIGSFISGLVADKFGRKKGMIYITFIMFLAGIIGGITKVAQSPECLMISRVLVGLHSGINIGLASLYLAEISPKSIRGAVGTCHQLAITIGIVLAQVLGIKELLGTPELWPILFAFNAFPALICLIFMPFCPESPRYLAVKLKQTALAEEALKKLRDSDDVSAEIEEMNLEAAKLPEAPFKVKELLTSRVHRLPVIIACLMMVFQQWSGINAVFSYSDFILTEAQVKPHIIPYAIIGTGAINVVATMIVVPLMEKLGRRPLLLFPMVGMIVSMLGLSIFLNLQQDMAYEAQHGWLAICSIIVMHTYIVGFALGLGPIPFNIVSELFTQAPRPAAMSMSLVFNWTANFILLLIFPFVLTAMGAYTFILFIVILSIAVVFIFFFVPETKNRTFEEVAQIIAAGKVWKKRGSIMQANGEGEAMDTTKV